MNKVNKIIDSFNKNEIDFNTLFEIVKISDIIFNDSEKKQFLDFYDNQFEIFYNEL